MSSFGYFQLRYNNKHVVHTLEAMQEVIAFYHNKNGDLLKLGCTLIKLSNICVHKFFDAYLYSSSEGDKDFFQKIKEYIVGGPFVVFTCKAVEDKTVIRKEMDLRKSIVGNDTCQLFPYSRRQSTPTGLHTRCYLDLETSRFILRQEKSVALKTWSCPIFNACDLFVKLKAFMRKADTKTFDLFSVDDFLHSATSYLWQWVVFITFNPVKK